MCGQCRIKGVQDQAKFLTDIYNRNLEHMKVIAGPALVFNPATTIPSGLRLIDKSKDLTIPPTQQLHNTSDTKQQLPWIFQPGGT